MYPLLLVVVLVLTSLVSATPLQELRQRCAGRRDGRDCLMASLAAYVDGVADPGGDVGLWSGLRISKVPEARLLDGGDDATAALDDKRDGGVGGSSEALLGRVLYDKLWGVARGRALVWSVVQGVEVRVAPAKDGGGLTLSLAETDAQDDQQEFTGRRRRRRRKGALSLLLAAAAVKLSAFGAILLKGVALLVTKAILVSKLALLVTLLGWVAKISSSSTSKKRHVTYEVVSHPQKVEHGAGEVIYPNPPPGWGRSSHELVYSAHEPSHQ